MNKLEYIKSEEFIEMITEVFPMQTITYEKHFVAR